MCEMLRQALILEAKAEPNWTPAQRQRHRRNTERFHSNMDAQIARGAGPDKTDGNIRASAERVLKPRLGSRNVVRRMGARSYLARVRRDGNDYADVGSIR